MSQNNQHTADVRNVTENDEVTFTLDDGTELVLLCLDRSRHHSEGVNVEQQDTWRFVATTDPDGTQYSLTITEGLSGTEGESPYPMHFPLIDESVNTRHGRIPDEAQLGYVTDVSIHGRAEQ